MILIGENIHVISKSVREALTNRDENFISELLKIQSNMDYADLNVGPAKGNLQGILPWLVELVESKSDLNISFDTSNFEEMKSGVEVCKRKMFLNSTSSDEPKLSNMIDLALENDCNLVALTLSKETGIPKTSDGRLEIAFNIYEKCLEKGFDSEKIFFDPLILPVCVDQSQGVEALNTIKMIMQGETVFPTKRIWLEELTEKEREILELYCHGHSRKDITYILGISMRTLANHLNVIYEKLDVSNYQEMVQKAIRMGYLLPKGEE